MLKKLKIWIVDDSPNDQNKLQAILICYEGSSKEDSNLFYTEREELANQVFEINTFYAVGAAIYALKYGNFKPDLILIDIDFSPLTQNLLDEKYPRQNLSEETETKKDRGLDLKKELDENYKLIKYLIWTNNPEITDDSIKQNALANATLGPNLFYNKGNSPILAYDVIRTMLKSKARDMVLANPTLRNELLKITQNIDSSYLVSQIKVKEETNFGGPELIILQNLIIGWAKFKLSDEKIIISFDDTKQVFKELLGDSDLLPQPRPSGKNKLMTALRQSMILDVFNSSQNNIDSESSRIAEGILNSCICNESCLLKINKKIHTPGLKIEFGSIIKDISESMVLTEQTKILLRNKSISLFNDEIFISKLTNLFTGMKIIAVLLKFEAAELEILKICYPILIGTSFTNSNTIPQIQYFFVSSYGFSKSSGMYLHSLPNINNFATSFIQEPNIIKN